MINELRKRHDFAVGIAHKAGERGMDHFRALDNLVIESKGHQDLVSNADKELEAIIRDGIEQAFPADGIVGEEQDDRQGTSGFVWVIDPIDGTANFVRGIPAWCVSIACALDGEAVVGVVHEPATGETFHGLRGGGAFLNARPIHASKSTSLGDGSLATGFSGRVDGANIVGLIGDLVGKGGVFFRNASGALMLAYVAAGRLIGYCEEHMNSWDCLAGLLLVKEAGGRIVEPDPARAIAYGAVAVASGPLVFEDVLALARRHFRI